MINVNELVNEIIYSDGLNLCLHTSIVYNGRGGRLVTDHWCYLLALLLTALYIHEPGDIVSNFLTIVAEYHAKILTSVDGLQTICFDTVSIKEYEIAKNKFSYCMENCIDLATGSYGPFSYYINK